MFSLQQNNHRGFCRYRSETRFFLNEKNHRFLAWTGVVWEITATDYLPGIKQHHSKHGLAPTAEELVKHHLIHV